MTEQSPELGLPTSLVTQYNCIPHPVHGLGRRTGTDHLKVLPGLSNTDRIWMNVVGRDQREKYVFIFDGRACRVFGLDGKELPVFTESVGYLSSLDPKADFELLPLIDTYLVTNRSKVVAMAANVAPAVSNVAIVWVRQGNYGQTYNVTVDGVTASHTTSTTVVTELATSKIAEDLAAAATTALGSDYFVTHTPGDSHFFIIRDPSIGIINEFGVTDSIGNTALGGCLHQAATFDELPPVAPDGYIVKVLGNSTDSADDYWVKWMADRDDTDAGTRFGSWVETTEPGIRTKLDNSTMPHILERLQDDTSGTLTGNPLGIYFRFRQATWGERVAGSETSNANPSIVGSTISTTFTVQGRLGLASKSNILMSGSGSLFQLFRTTVTQLLDEDRIDYNIQETRKSDEPVLNIRHVLGFQEELLIGGDRSQTTVPLDEALTVRTFRPRPVGSYEMDPDCRPVSMGRSVLMPYSNGTTVGVWEFYTQGPNSAKEEDKLTKYIPTLIRGRPWQISVCPAENTVFLRTTEQRNGLWMYRQEVVNNQRVQSAWGIWDFGAEVLGFGVIDSTLYLVIARPEGPTLESLEIPPFVQTELTPQPLLLDRKTPIGVARMRGRVSTAGGVGDSGPGVSTGGTNPGTNPGTTPGTGPGTDPGTDPGTGTGTGPGAGGAGGTITEGGWPAEDELPTPPPGGGTTDGTIIVLDPIDNDIPADTDILEWIQAPENAITTSTPSDARDRGVITEYNRLTNTSYVMMPWDPPTGTVFIRADTMEELPWVRTARFTVAIEGDIQTIPVYAGYPYKHEFWFRQAVVIKQSQTGGLVIERGRRIQLTQWQVNYSKAGPFYIEVRRRGRLMSQLKKFTPRRIGTIPTNRASPGIARVTCPGKSEDIQIIVSATSHWPCWVVSASWTGEVIDGPPRT